MNWGRKRWRRSPLKSPAAADRVPLRIKLQCVERRRKLRVFVLVLPLLLFILIAFVLPIGRMMFNAVNDDTY